MSKYTDPENEGCTILPEGFIHARIESVEIKGEGDDERIESIRVVDHNTLDEVFSVSWPDFCGDDRGFPACLVASMDDLLAEWAAAAEGEDGPEDPHGFQRAAEIFNGDEEVHLHPQFVLDKRGTDYSKMTHKGIRFGGWVKGWELDDESVRERDEDIDNAIGYLRENDPA